MKVFRDPDEIIEVAPGEAFAIAAEGVPTAGYSWKPEYDEEVLELLTVGGPKTVTSSPSIGGAAEEVLEFRAKAQAETEIALQFGREWESKPRESRTFRVTIVA